MEGVLRIDQWRNGSGGMCYVLQREGGRDAPGLNGREAASSKGGKIERRLDQASKSL